MGDRCKRRKRTVKPTWKKTDVKAKPYPKRSKEKSPRAAITQPAAVSSTDRATWKRLRAWNIIEFTIKNINPTPKHYNGIYLSCWFAFTKEKPGNQNSEWSESLNGDIHWNIDSFQACKSKCNISIVEDRNREKLFRSGQIDSFSSCVSHSSTKVYKQWSSQLLIQPKEKQKGPIHNQHFEEMSNLWL